MIDEKFRGGLDLGSYVCIITQMSKNKADTTKSSQNPAQELQIGLPVAECCSETLENYLPAAFFKALGDPNRIALLARLAVCGRPSTVSEIACCLPIDLSVVSRHLRQLKDAGILECEKQGKEVLYEVRYQSIVSMLRGIADAMEQCCPENGCCGAPTNQSKPGAQASRKRTNSRNPSTRRKKP